MTIAITGSNGFLGWHTRVLAHSLGMAVEPIALGDKFHAEDAVAAVEDAAMVVHVAGVNRGDDDAVRRGNELFAEQLARALESSNRKPSTVVYANSIQSGNGSSYGRGKEQAGRILEKAAEKIGARFVDVKLPNLFGEHGLPFYNSVVATFCHLAANGEPLKVNDDKELVLLHVQTAAEVLLGLHEPEDVLGLATTRLVSEVAALIEETAAQYSTGTIPDISDPFKRDMFNTYRSFLVGERLPVSLDRHEDARGAFFEIVRNRGGEGQSSFSTTAPGVTRGQHYHRRKVERFAVLSGTAEISMRKLFTDEVVSYQVDGRKPVAIDMPTMWSHNITNTGSDTLYTMFWINEIFDPTSPDTFPEEV
ncbi:MULTISPECIES: capsular biosynthesis protein [unclassified Arthrobacter]|uniref:polysaccharide biosynthesis C-terminal domain-containing protein n=1 Tax=unclassified Arthrobacter TaxID=235627 RepID=UPI001CFFF4A0|nr:MULTISPECIES: capsular biosynthesis protein [unclassified Arthrobacter]MCB5283209.1 UDP-2-acetamido-2,6-beta-L-arabino-hexul-4-ose reductase [Arthrobacter sp. ES1]WGZ78445.1 capsular biosynthesis protein [Arthrobacter sp. EM1]